MRLTDAQYLLNGIDMTQSVTHEHEDMNVIFDGLQQRSEKQLLSRAFSRSLYQASQL
jgi:hypothetical protein